MSRFYKSFCKLWDLMMLCTVKKSGWNTVKHWAKAIVCDICFEFNSAAKENC